MKQITEIPNNADDLNNRELREIFTNKDGEGVLFRSLSADGLNNTGDWLIITLWNEDESAKVDVFIYHSEAEYDEDCEILNLL